MRVSGWILRAQFLYLKQRGRQDFEELVRGFQPATRASIEDGFLETRWYPHELLVEIGELADRTLGDGQGRICEEMGAFACAHALRSSHRLLFKFGDVDWLIDRSSEAWSSNFDEGDLNAHRTPGGAVVITLLGLEAIDRVTAHLIKGWMERAAELSGEDSFVCTMELGYSPDVPARWRFAMPVVPG